ncbi:MAG: pyridoxal phosphate-dependent aminotransferase family protein [Candidatus Riflebacteria bacterium]|nr:pyridoxal phosphate-dependent aminotransferase family protein [Candidatus Riflebacteria bacterium]
METENKSGVKIDTTEGLYDVHADSNDIFDKAAYFFNQYQQIKSSGYYFYRRPLLSACGNKVTVMNEETGKPQEMLLFSSNSYLGLSTDSRVVEASIKAAEKYGYGTGSVALMSGTTDLLLELEKQIAEFYKCEAAAVFPTGYQANVGTIQALLGGKDVALSDMFSHASIIDGVVLSEGILKYFQHNDMESLEALLKRASRHFKGKLIVTDGVFSMDGDIAPLDRLHELARKYNARLLIDEAHALGIIGKNGRGTAEYFGLEGKIDLTIGTLSKAPSAIGGYLTGKKDVVEYVRHFARSYIFSTSIPTPVVAGLIEVFKILANDPEPRKKLTFNTSHLNKGLLELGFNTLGSTTAIIPVLIPDENKLRLVCKELFDCGFYVSPVTFPAVAKGRARLRISVSAAHTLSDLNSLLENLKDLKKKHEL